MTVQGYIVVAAIGFAVGYVSGVPVPSKVSEAAESPVVKPGKKECKNGFMHNGSIIERDRKGKKVPCLRI